MENEQLNTPENQTTVNEKQPVEKKKKRTAVRSPLLFPAYDFGEACRIAEKVETTGAGKLEEATLAIALNMSVKSSGFLLRSLTARQFKLLQKNGPVLETTKLAKSIFKPISNEEKINAMRESFLSIPLFNTIATRFKGQPIPQGDVFRNILERELRIPQSRIVSAERVFLDSAREAQVLTTSGSKTYLTASVDTGLITPEEERIHSEEIGYEGNVEEQRQHEYMSSARGRNISSSSGDLLTISAMDLAEFDPKEFNEIWGAIGKIVVKRGKRLLEQENKEE
jgi:hypothetical protein